MYLTALYSLLAGVDATVEVWVVVGRDIVVDTSSTTNVNYIQVSVQPFLMYSTCCCMFPVVSIASVA